MAKLFLALHASYVDTPVAHIIMEYIFNIQDIAISYMVQNVMQKYWL